ncbi:unnamed protein product [Pieris macdunnoughi]|uniref:Uncharacterized protein n=1 Tax=Pieris macdunnoughi TaxID=345717 RepID=A0A821U1N1_9NEOP|nr:unnamed protein product [Pieris macdunnoughi]
MPPRFSFQLSFCSMMKIQLFRTNPASRQTSAGNGSALLIKIFYISKLRPPLRQNKVRRSSQQIRRVWMAIRDTFLRIFGYFMNDSMIYEGGVLSGCGVREASARVAQGSTAARHWRTLHRSRDELYAARPSQPPPTLISNHPTPRYLSEFSGQSWNH